MGDHLYTLEYVSTFRASDRNAVAYIRKYFSGDYWLRVVLCLARVIGVALAAALVVWIAVHLFVKPSGLYADNSIYVIGIYCGLAAFPASIALNRALLPFTLNSLYRQFTVLVPDERVRLELSEVNVSWLSESMSLVVPLESIVAVLRTPTGITIGIGGAWSRFIPLTAFSNSSELNAFLRHLKQHLNLGALSRSAAAFDGVEV